MSLVSRLTTTVPLLVLLAVCSACSTGGGRVDLDRFRGVYTTHFDGIPDRAAVCAVLTNRDTTPVDWVRLRLQSVSHLGEGPGKWVSNWVYRGRIHPGETVLVELRDPPVSEQIRLNLRSTGRGPVPLGGRPAFATKRCSEPALRARLEAEAHGRTATGREVLPVVRRNDGAREVEVLVADDGGPRTGAEAEAGAELNGDRVR